MAFQNVAQPPSAVPGDFHSRGRLCYLENRRCLDMRRILPVLITGSLWLGIIVPTVPGRVNKIWPTLERQFHQLPIEARRLIGPLFWLHGDESPRAAGDVRRQGGRGRQRLFYRRKPPAQRLAGAGLVSRPGDLPGGGQAAPFEDVDLRRKVVAQPGHRRQGAAALRRQTSGGRGRRRGRTSRVGRRRLRRPALHRRGGRPRHGRRQDRRRQPYRLGAAHP